MVCVCVCVCARAPPRNVCVCVCVHTYIHTYIHIGCAIEVRGTSEGPIEDWKDKDGDGCEFWDDTARCV